MEDFGSASFAGSNSGRRLSDFDLPVGDNEIPPIIQDFIENFPFTGKVLFDLKKENHELMVSILDRILDRSQTEKERIADIFDNRLSVIPLLLSVPDEMFWRFWKQLRRASRRTRPFLRWQDLIFRGCGSAMGNHIFQNLSVFS